MKLAADTVTIVIAGAWNPYILQPAWVLERVPDAKPGNEQPLTTEFSVGAVAPPRFIFPGILGYQVNNAALVLAPQTIDETNVARVAATARNILADLKHTPVTGVGYNFQFDADDAGSATHQIRGAQQDVVDAMPAGFQVISNEIRTSISKDGLLLNISKEFQAGKLSLKFNFHHPALTTESVARVIEESSMWGAFMQSVALSEAILQERLSDDQ